MPPTQQDLTKEGFTKELQKLEKQLQVSQLQDQLKGLEAEKEKQDRRLTISEAQAFHATKDTALMNLEKEYTQLKGQQIKQDFDPIVKQVQGLAIRSVNTIQGAIARQQQDSQAGLQMINDAIDDPSLLTPVQLLGGGIQYTYSPISGAVEGLVATPFKDQFLSLGLSENASTFLSRLPAETVYVTSPSSFLNKLRSVAPPGLRAGEVIKTARPHAAKEVVKDEAVKETQKKGLALSKEAELANPNGLPYAPSTNVSGTKFPKDILLAPHVKEEITEKVTKAAIDVLDGNLPKGKRLFKEVTDKIKVGELAVEDLPDIMKAYDLSVGEVADLMAETWSRAGRQLNQLSRLKNKMTHLYADNPDALAAFEKAFVNENSRVIPRYAQAMDFIKKIENKRRGMLITQMATTMRNIWSQAGRMSVAALDESMQSVILGDIKGDIWGELKNTMNATSAMYSRLTPKGRATFNNIYDSNQATLAKKVLEGPVHEFVAGSKFSRILNGMNHFQEMKFRRFAFEAKTRQLLKRNGMDWDTVKPDDIPLDLLKESTDYAMEMTFAKTPSSKAAQDFIRGWQNVGLTTVNPFPRFAFGNALPFIWNHSPLGYMNMLDPRTIKALASGNPEQFAKAASRATLGTMWLASAWDLRQSAHSGEKWYEIIPDPENAPDQVVDLRAFAPLSTYLFVADAFIHPERLKPADFIEAAIGLNRIAGSGLVVTDLMRAQTEESSTKIMENFIGEYAASFTVPLRQFKDFTAFMDDNEAIQRDKRDNRLLGPILNNIPILSQTLPERESPIEMKRLKSEHPLLRQFTGISKKSKGLVAKELDDLGYEFSRVSPRTNHPEADRELRKIMAPMVENFAPVMMKTDFYLEHSDAGKKVLWSLLFTQIREAARQILVRERPMLGLKLYSLGLGKDVQQLLNEQGFDPKVIDNLVEMESSLKRLR